jgi:hypothetical protein
MVYKKYIKKNGKFYGPYIYNSRRVNGKVISEYQGTGKNDNKRFVFLILGILFVVLLTFFIFNFKGKISGNVIANNQISSQTENSLINQTGNIIYPNVYFTLISTQKEISNQTVNIQNSDNNTIVNNSPTSEINSTSSTETPITNETNSSTSSEQITTSENQTPTETSTTNSSASTTDSTNSEATTTDASQTTSASSETTSNTSTPETTSNTSTPETSSTSITGNVISGILKTVSNFFLGFLKPTGMAVQQNINGEIQGQVSANNQFSYSLKDGETIQLLSGSVKTDSKSLSDNVIQIVYQGNNVLVSTNYSETVQSNATNSTQLNSTVVQINFNVEQLTEQEKEILTKEFGNYSIQTTKSELFNGRYVVGYQLGDYTIEYSYDSNLSNEALKTQIENDKIKWLRDIANELSSVSTVAQSYSLPA